MLVDTEQVTAGEGFTEQGLLAEGFTEQVTDVDQRFQDSNLHSSFQNSHPLSKISQEIKLRKEIVVRSVNATAGLLDIHHK